MTSYVLGFVFNEFSNEVLLIKKNKPEWQKGLANGLGGKIEDYDETPAHAMSREIKEEANLDISPENWTHYATMIGKDWEVLVFKTFANLDDASQMEEEKLLQWSVTDVLAEFAGGQKPFVSNLPWLIQAALDGNYGNPPHIIAHYS